MNDTNQYGQAWWTWDGTPGHLNYIKHRLLNEMKQQDPYLNNVTIHETRFVTLQDDKQWYEPVLFIKGGHIKYIIQLARSRLRQIYNFDGLFTIARSSTKLLSMNDTISGLEDAEPLFVRVFNDSKDQVAYRLRMPRSIKPQVCEFEGWMCDPCPERCDICHVVLVDDAMHWCAQNCMRHWWCNVLIRRDECGCDDCRKIRQ